MTYIKEIERQLIGMILFDGAAAGLALDAGLREDDFKQPTCRRVFGAVGELFREGKSITLSGVLDRLRTGGLTEGELGIITGLKAEIVSTVGIAGLIESILNASAARSIGKVADDIGRRAKQGGDRQALLDYAEAQILAVADRDISTGEVVTLQKLADDYATTRQELMKRGIEIGGGGGLISELNDILGGMRPGRLYILAARPGVGKSALALNLSYHAAVKGNAVAFINLEMEPVELLERLAGIASNCDIFNVQDNPEKLQALYRGINQIEKLPIYIRDVPGVGLAGVCSMARADIQRRNIKLLVIDYLQLLAGEKR